MPPRRPFLLLSFARAYVFMPSLCKFIHDKKFIFFDFLCKMPCCCAVNCSERSENGVRLFLLPQGERNKERTKKWIANLKRTALPSRVYVCEKHFTDDQFENNRTDNKRPLRWNAIPTIFSHKKAEKPRKPPAVRYNTENDNQHSTNEDLMIVDPINDLVNSYSNPSAEIEANPEILELKRKINLQQNKIRKLNEETNTLREQIKNVFNEDQIDFLKRGRMTGRQWQIETIKKSLKLYLSCGTTGYEELRRQNYPLPSIRTLQKRIEDFKFQSGLLQELFPLLESKIECMKPEEKHAILLVDEMSIRPGLQLDNSTGQIVGKSTMPKSGEELDNTIATHALVFMLAGLTTRWKQTVAYEYTANSYSADEANKRIKEILAKCKAINLNICAVVSDMGPQNQAVWRLNGIICSRYSKTINFCPHPCPTEVQDKLYFMPDSPHVFKNLRLSLTDGNTFYLAENVVKRFSLPSNKINLIAVKQVILEDKNRELKVAPRLTEQIIKPGHFDKMNVGYALALINRDVAAAIKYFISENKIDKEHLTTAWFFELMHKWFCIMNCRSPKLALSHNHEEDYEEAILFLQNVIFIIENISVGLKGHWKPFQTGVILATQTALDIQDTYINKNNIKYLMLGRFTQDALENLFSNVRSRNPIPDAKEFKTALRLISISQFFSPPKHGSYGINDCEQLVDFLKSNKVPDKADEEEEEYDEEIFNLCSFTDNVSISTDEQQSLYYLIGSILLKIKNNFKTCDACFSVVINNSNDQSINFVSKLVNLKCYKENSLLYASKMLFDHLLQAEILFRGSSKMLLEGKLTLKTLISNFISHSNDTFPKCHNINEKILKIYFRTRLYFFLKQHTSEVIKNIKQSSKCGSRSIGMRIAVNNI